MADQKVSNLPALNGADVDSADLLYIVDSSAGTAGSKKITIGQYQLAPVSGGTANGVTYLNASKVQTSGSALTFDGTNLGVGTSSPGAKLEVASGKVLLSNTQSYAIKTATGASCDLVTFTSGDVLQLGGGGATNSVQFWNQGLERMRLDSSGNLGIGTSSPATKLHVNSAATDEVARFEGTGNPYISVYDSGTRQLYFGSIGASDVDFWVETNKNLRFATNNTERARITSGGDLLVGTVSSDGSRLRVYGSYQTLGDGAYEGLIGKSSSLVSGGGAGDFAVRSAANLVFATNGNTERARITSGGDLLVGDTTQPTSADNRLAVIGTRGIDCKNTGGATAPNITAWNNATTGDNIFVSFRTETTDTARGSISYNRAGGLVAYNTTSDYRAKNILGPVADPGATIDALKVYEGRMKGATQSRPMLVAHEAQEYAPYAVSGEKDEVNEDGTPKYQQMDVSSLVPLLLAEIQSLRARVAALEAK